MGIELLYWNIGIFVDEETVAIDHVSGHVEGAEFVSKICIWGDPTLCGKYVEGLHMIVNA